MTTSVQSVKKKQNNHAIFRSSPHALALTSHLPLYSSLLSTHRPTASPMHQATSAHFSLLVSASRHERFSHAYASLACMYTLHACFVSHASTTVHASLLYMYTFHLVLRVSMHLLHIIHYTTVLYLYSVLLGRASSAVMSASRRAPLSCNVCSTSVACHVYSAHALQALVQDTRVNLRRTPESQIAQETACVMDIV